jgi:DNA-binding CsgD family transcriptional regulator
MIAVIFHAAYRKKLSAPTHTLLLCCAVGVNIGVWLLEKLIPVSFELLSLSYIFTELFLLGLHMLLQEQQRKLPPPAAPPEVPTDAVTPEQCQFYLAHLSLLTPTERIILDLYLSGKSAKDVLVDQHIKENTLKYHNRNIYSKLGVSSRKQLLKIAAAAKSMQK